MIKLLNCIPSEKLCSNFLNSVFLVLSSYYLGSSVSVLLHLLLIMAVKWFFIFSMKFLPWKLFELEIQRIHIAQELCTTALLLMYAIIGFSRVKGGH
jgi:hypothetical protein